MGTFIYYKKLIILKAINWYHITRCIMEICITRYNNKTLYENMLYNLHLSKSENVLRHETIFREWRTVKVPHLENMIKSNSKRIHRTDCPLEKRSLRKINTVLRKDVDLFRSMESDFYEMELDKIKNFDDSILEWKYNVPISIHHSVNKRVIYVLEMNNDTNEIYGVSKLQNRCFHRRHNIYSDRNYNRYTYEGNRIQMCKYKSLQIYKDELEDILFKGSTHQKRGQGIQKIAKKNAERCSLSKLSRALDEIFA